MYQGKIKGLQIVIFLKYIRAEHQRRMNTQKVIIRSMFESRVVFLFYPTTMYHHTPQDQAILDAMTQEEKQKRLTLTEIRKRAWQSLKKYRYWLVVNNDYPYDWVKESLVVRYRHSYKYPHPLARVERGEIEREYKETHKVFRNEIEGMSCPSRYHFHLIQH